MVKLRKRDLIHIVLTLTQTKDNLLILILAILLVTLYYGINKCLAELQKLVY